MATNPPALSDDAARALSGVRAGVGLGGLDPMVRRELYINGYAYPSTTIDGLVIVTRKGHLRGRLIANAR